MNDPKLFLYAFSATQDGMMTIHVNGTNYEVNWREAKDIATCIRRVAILARWRSEEREGEE